MKPGRLLLLKSLFLLKLFLSRLSLPGLLSRTLLLIVASSFAGGLVNAEQLTDIYQPRVLEAGVASDADIEQRHGSWGVGIAQIAQENLPSTLGLNASARYFAGERWYVLANIQLANLSDRVIRDDQGETLVKKDVTSVLVNTGLGYQLMQGNASFSGNRSYPWQFALEGYLGEQFNGESSGLYYGVGSSWQLQINDFWVSLDLKNFTIADDNLKQAEIDNGIQWGITFGSYY
ncbi:hypothetical protein [Bacterioplanoides sp. SCSIO 12839]|uniref:hypothetical protein n=1 Tax=Bacterioplanoides sp. SCSIO 12839 TaxID=2829569 RepID=UPI00210445ED|nr:hypothetical protein [Bacterioplanoides sp. SCSIO 12839]UTW49749.1 hypothetical protein KFF03_07660 [Bacterioplanoides sp. SCSIO 12839]